MTDTTMAALIGGVAGSAVTGIFGFITIQLQRRADERRQIRELAVKVALENWKIYKAAADDVGGSVPPIDSFLVHAVHLVSALDGSLKTDEQIRCHLRRGFEASNAADKEIDERNKQLREERKKGAA
jgi:hypothetical protein